METGKTRIESNMTSHAGVKGKYALVNGLNMYYETHGSSTGTPLVLLHGGVSATGTSFGKVLPAFAKTRRVISIEQQGHGHTADVDRPLDFAQMAQDTAALLRQIGVEKADFLGYSMGSGIALQLAIKHPQMVRKLVLISLSYNREGQHPGLAEGMKNMKPEDLAGTPFQEEYARIAPHPEDWPKLIEKTKQQDDVFQGWTAEDVGAVKAPTLIVIGDSDIVRPEHAVEMFRLLGGGVAGDVVGLPNSQLALLPGTTHITVVHRAEWLTSMVEVFLEAPMPETK